MRRENEWICQVLKDSGLTQEQFCSVLGISRREINYWGSGDRVPSEMILNRACRTFLTPSGDSFAEGPLSFEERARIASSSFWCSQAADEASRLLAQGFQAAQKSKWFHVFLHRFQEFLHDAEKDLRLPGIAKGHRPPDMSLREILRREFFAEMSREADRLSSRSAEIKPEREQCTVRRKQELYSLKKRLSDRAIRLEKRIGRGRVADKALLKYFQNRKFLLLPDKTLFQFKKDISLDYVFTFPSCSVIAKYWEDVFRHISDGRPEPPDSEFDDYDRNFLPELATTRLSGNAVEFVVREKNDGNDAALVKVDYAAGFTPDLPLKNFSPAKKLPAHMGFGCRVHFAENELAFLRVRATDDRNHDWLSPLFCTDSFGSHVIFQHWGYPLEQIRPLYLGYFERERSASKTASKGVEPDQPEPLRVLKKKTLAKEKDIT